MGGEMTRRAAEEYLAAKLSEEGQLCEQKMNAEAAVMLAPAVWKYFAETVATQCREWNAITKEQTFTCKETMLGDLRIWCVAKSRQMTVHYDSRRRQVTIKNSARPEHEGDLVLSIEGYATDSGRGARLVRHDQPANAEALIVAQLRILSGLDRSKV